MKILTAEQFIKEPYGTVYRICDSEEICIKYSTRGEPFGQSWWAIYTLPEIKNNDDRFGRIYKNGEWIKVGKFNTEIETKIICTDDAIYNHDDDDIYYVVFNKNEINEMISVLQDALNKLTNDNN